VTYLADGSPIEYSDVWIRSDRMPVTSLLSRP
jgi:DNA-binding GntR family transcriptional regulator